MKIAITDDGHVQKTRQSVSSFLFLREETVSKKESSNSCKIRQCFSFYTNFWILCKGRRGSFQHNFILIPNCHAGKMGRNKARHGEGDPRLWLTAASRVLVECRNLATSDSFRKFQMGPPPALPSLAASLLHCKTLSTYHRQTLPNYVTLVKRYRFRQMRPEGRQC